MDTYELDTLTLHYTRQEDTPENRVLLSPLFLQAYNEAYAAIVREKIQPVRWEEVTLDETETLDGAALGYPAERILRVEDENGAALPLEVMEYGLYRMPGHAKEQVRVQYRYLPRPLSAQDSPVLLPQDAQGALSLFAAARIHAANMQLNRSEFYMQKYYETVAGIRRLDEGERGRFTAKYPLAPR